MVVPIELDETAQAAVDAARASSDGRLLVAPRLEDRYASYGVVADRRAGRPASSGGARPPCCEAERRARIGTGVTGPGAALWVEAEPSRTRRRRDDARELAEEYKRLVVAVLQRREAWQVIDTVHQMTDPSALADPAGYAPYLDRRAEARAARDPDVERAARAR